MWILSFQLNGLISWSNISIVKKYIFIFHRAMGSLHSIAAQYHVHRRPWTGQTERYYRKNKSPSGRPHA